MIEGAETEQPNRMDVLWSNYCVATVENKIKEEKMVLSCFCCNA